MTQRLEFGSDDLRLPDALRAPLLEHLKDLRGKYLARGWGERVGFGERPALIVIDLAKYWLDTRVPIGANLDSVVEQTCHVLAAARLAGIPIFFTSFAHDPADAAYYAARGADFQQRWQEAIGRWETRAVPLKGLPVVVIHSDQAYLCQWLGLKQVASIEPKPAVPPSAGT